MNIETLIQIILALSTVVGGAIAAFATYRSTNSSVKNEDVRTSLDVMRVNREMGLGGIESAERISNISLANAQFMQSQFSEAINRIKELQDTLNSCEIRSSQKQVKTLKTISKLRRLLSEHDKLFEEEGSSCKAYSFLQNQISTIVEELEQEFSE